MNAFEKLLVCGLMVGGLVACDTDTTDDGGATGTDAAGLDMGADMAVVEATYDWVLVIDDTTDENMNGTPGADICGITATCAGASVGAVAALLTSGDGDLCDMIREGCSADRTDPNAARDDGSACEPASAPSDYVSLGIGGTLSVQFGQTLAGCSLDVVELEGSQVEAYEVYVCDGPDASATCISGAALGTAAMGGTITVDVP